MPPSPKPRELQNGLEDRHEDDLREIESIPRTLLGIRGEKLEGDQVARARERNFELRRRFE